VAPLGSARTPPRFPGCPHPQRRAAQRCPLRRGQTRLEILAGTAPRRPAERVHVGVSSRGECWLGGRVCGFECVDLATKWEPGGNWHKRTQLCSTWDAGLVRDAQWERICQLDWPATS